MHSGAKLLRKTLTGTERTNEHKARKSKSLARLDKKVTRVNAQLLVIVLLTFYYFTDIGRHSTCGDDETLRANCSSRLDRSPYI